MYLNVTRRLLKCLKNIVDPKKSKACALAQISCSEACLYGKLIGSKAGQSVNLPFENKYKCSPFLQDLAGAPMW